MSAQAQWCKLAQYCIDYAPAQLREPAGNLRFPYLSPAQADSPYYSSVQWDWDSYFASVSLEQITQITGEVGKYREYQLGTIRNFLAAQDAEGRIPPMLDVASELWDPLSATDPQRGNIHKPVLAQHLLLLVRCGLDFAAVADLIEPLRKFVDFYLAHFVHADTGLAFWHTDFAIGVDNDPAIFYRPNFATGSVYLSSLLYKELCAFAELLALAEVPGAAYEAAAQELKVAVQRECWDERDQLFYNVDLNLRPIDSSFWLHSGAPRAWKSLPIRIAGWSSFLPLWAGIATPDQARAVAEHMLDPQTFFAPYGVRTLSAKEPMYNLAGSNNPSNWLGPAWGMSSYLSYRALRVNGFAEHARELGGRHLRLFSEDLEATGTLHEYYDPDSGEPVITPGFLNWNLLAINIWADLSEEGHPVVTEY